MSRYDEHGRVDLDRAEPYGPEWWAMGAELCKCGHRLDEHSEVVDRYGDGSETVWKCDAAVYLPAEADMTPCSCQDFRPELDK